MTEDAPNSRFGRLRRSRPAELLREARSDDLGTHLLAVSAQQLLRTAPLAVAIGAVSQRVVGVSMAEVLTHVLRLDQTTQQAVDGSFARSSRVSPLALSTNLVIAVAFGVGLAATLQRGLEMIWRYPRAPALPSVVRQAVWALTLPVLIIAIIATGRSTRAGSPDIAPLVVLGLVGQIALIGVFAWWTQWLLLARREPWRQLWPAAGLFVGTMVLVWVTSRVLISGQILSAYRAYGPVGIMIVLSAWVAVTSTATMAGLTGGCWLSRLGPSATR